MVGRRLDVHDVGEVFRKWIFWIMKVAILYVALSEENLLRFGMELKEAVAF